MAVDSSKTVELAALGRPFSLGMLYDCRNDSLIPVIPKCLSTRFHTAKFLVMLIAIIIIIIIIIIVWLWNVHVTVLALSGEDRQEIEGNLKVLMKKIPTLKIEGQGFLDMGEKDIANVEKFSCKFHGDFNLEKNPVSFREAIEVYQSLPKMLGANGEKAVPQKVWLMPLKTLDNNAAQLVRQISDRLVKDAQNVLEDISELERRCNDAERRSTAKQFPQINKKLKAFKELVSQYKLEFQNIMAKKLPMIRGGGEDESVLAKILKKVHSSPFKSGELNEWMESKEIEIQLISSLIDKMPNMTIVTSRSTLHHEIHSRDITYAVCFVFTSLETPEPYLSALSNYLDETQTDNVPCAYDVEKEQWFFSSDVMDKLKEKEKLFKDFAEANKENNSIRFLTAATRDDGKKGATLHLYEDGSLVTDNFEPPSKPEMITGDVTHNSVTLNISPPRFGLTTVNHYTIEFCVHGGDDWHQQIESKAGDVTVSGLQINKEYQFRCRAKCAVGFGPACVSLIKTKVISSTDLSKQLAEAVKNEGRKIKGHLGNLDIYAPPLKLQSMNVEGCQRFIFGKDSVKQNRTIMLLGATGAGKSTLVNRMINYILGVTWDDTFRFKLVDEGTAVSQADSQTSEVTVYKLNHREGFQIDYSLTIVDTPGFGDTRGIERDRLIVTQLQRLFSAEHGVREIAAICFVVQASHPRLTTTQKYLFDLVLSIFGKDVAENIQILVTFAVTQGTPSVLWAINETGVPCPKRKDGLPIHFKFNNCALFDVKVDDDDDATDDEEDQSSKMFWDMGTKSMKKFFSALNVIVTKSLTLTKEVLRQRGELENWRAKLEEITLESQILQEHEAVMTANAEFEYEVRFGYGGVTEKRICKELKQKYERASKAKMSVEDIIKQMRLEYDLLQYDVVRLMELSAQCLNTLKEIALKPVPLSTPEYIDLLIEAEKSELKPGYRERINKLLHMREKAVTMERVARGDKLL
ncbi:unnamed protein product [Boreogadus saida]